MSGRDILDSLNYHVQEDQLSFAAGLRDKVLTFDMCSCYRHMHPQLVLVGGI